MILRHPIWILALVGAVATLTSAQTTQPADAPAAEPTTQPAWVPPVSLDSVVARFDDVTITEGDLLDRYLAWINEKRPGMNRSEQETWDALQRVRKGVLRVVIDERLLDREVEKAGITVTDDQRRDELEQRIEGLMMARGITREEFAEMVSEQSGKPFEEVYQEQLANPRFRQFLAQWQLIERLRPEKAEVTEEEVEEYYQLNLARVYDKPEQVRASHILIKVAPDATEEQKAEARKKIEALLEQVEEPGADFAAIAKASSECPSSSRGGDLGFFPRTKMVKEFSDAAFAMDVGEVSGIVETQFGFHIIKVTDKRAAKLIPLEEAKYPILHLLKERAIEKAKNEFAKELREKEDVVYTNPDDKEEPPPPPPATSSSGSSSSAKPTPPPTTQPSGTIKPMPEPKTEPAGNPGAR